VIQIYSVFVICNFYSLTAFDFVHSIVDIYTYNMSKQTGEVLGRVSNITF